MGYGIYTMGGSARVQHAKVEGRGGSMKDEGSHGGAGRGQPPQRRVHGWRQHHEGHGQTTVEGPWTEVAVRGRGSYIEVGVHGVRESQ